MVTVVIVNWNGEHYIGSCVLSLTFCRDIIDKIVVIDNNSSDRSVDILKSFEADSTITLIQNNENLGFAKACNQGFSFCESNYVLFLNPDTTIRREALLLALESFKFNIGIVGVQLRDSEGLVSQSCSFFPTWRRLAVQSIGLNRVSIFKNAGVHMLGWDHLSSKCVDQVMGAFFLVRSSLFRELRGFDERFFVYYEEVDFSIRAHKIGYHSYYCSEASIYHEGGGVSRTALQKRLFYSLNSRIAYGRKHFSLISFSILLVTTYAFEPIFRYIYTLWRFKSSADAYHAGLVYYRSLAWLLSELLNLKK